MPSRKDFYAPTPEEIRAGCQQIQQNWNEREHMKRLRADLRPIGWDTPVIKTQEVDVDINTIDFY